MWPNEQADLLPVNTNPRTVAQAGSRAGLNALPSLRILRTLITTEGPSPFRSLYRGLTPNLVGNSLGWSLYFLWYSQAQDVVRHVRHYPKDTQITSLDYLTASLASGILSATLTNPIWVIKTRMLSTSAHHTGAYPSMLFGLRAIARVEGWRGYFRGLIPTLAGVSHSAIYFVAYEKLKAERANQLSSSSSNHHGASASKQQLSNADYLLISGLSKIFAGTLTYPHQVVRARMQTYTPPRSPTQPNRPHDKTAPQQRLPGTTGHDPLRLAPGWDWRILQGLGAESASRGAEYVRHVFGVRECEVGPSTEAGGGHGGESGGSAMMMMMMMRFGFLGNTRIVLARWKPLDKH